MTNTLTVIISLFVGYIFGFLITVLLWWISARRPDGYFFVNLVNPEDEMFKMQIDVPLEKIPQVKYLIFKVKKIQ